MSKPSFFGGLVRAVADAIYARLHFPNTFTDSPQEIDIADGSKKGLVVKAAAFSQTANLIEAQAPAGTPTFFVDGNGITVVQCGNDSAEGLVVVAHSATQSARVVQHLAGNFLVSNSAYVCADLSGNELWRLWGTDTDPNNYNFGNLYVGYQAGFSQPDAVSNPLAGYDNVGIGWRSLYSVTEGYDNMGLGFKALTLCTTGTQNTAVGSQALPALTTGNFNVGVGTYALKVATTGEYNTALGFGSSLGLTTGVSNVGVGQWTFYYLTTGGTNVAVGAGALSQLVDGNNNVGVGAINGTDLYGNGYPPIVHGSDNTYCGFNAGPNGDYSDTLCLGSQATATASHHAVVGGPTVTDVYFGSESALANLHAAAITASGLMTVGSFKLATGAGAGKVLTSDASGNGTWGAVAGTGTVTSVSVATANGVSGSVATATTTPAITLTLGAITPSSVNGNTITAGTGTLTLSTFTLTVAGTASVSGTNTGDQTNVPGSSGSCTGNAATATALQTGRAINGVTFDGTGPITVTAAAGTLTGATLAANVLATSITSTGTLTGGATGAGFTMALGASTVTGTLAKANGGTAEDNSTGGTANTFWARPDGATGAAAYRLLLPRDLPAVVTPLADAATVTVNWALGRMFDVASLTASRTMAFTNDFNGGSVILRFNSGGTGAFVPVWPATVHWQGGAAPTLSNLAGKYDLVSISRFASGDYMGSIAPNYS